MDERGRSTAERFCAAQFPRLVGGLALYLGDRAVAEELAQEALLRAFTRWERVSRLESPEGWTWRVALNLANSALRRRAAERRARSRIGPDPTAPADDVSVAHVVVRRAVAVLPARQREALVLRFYADLSVEDTAARMGVTNDAVRSLTKRGVARLRRDLGADETARQLQEADDDA